MGRVLTLLHISDGLLFVTIGLSPLVHLIPHPQTATSFRLLFNNIPAFQIKETSKPFSDRSHHTSPLALASGYLEPDRGLLGYRQKAHRPKRLVKTKGWDKGEMEGSKQEACLSHQRDAMTSI